MAKYILDPSATLDYSVDWSAWLANGETISSHTVTVPTGVTKQSESAAGGVVTFWLTAGVLGSEVDVSCHIVTSAGRADDRSITVLVANR